MSAVLGTLLEDRVRDRLHRLLEEGVIQPFDYHFARGLSRFDSSVVTEVLLGLAFASRAVAMGHVCADLVRLQRTPLMTREGKPSNVTLPKTRDWVNYLRKSPLVGDGSIRTPLVLEDNRKLYLYRYWRYQQTLAENLNQRTGADFEAVHPETMRTGLDTLFTGTAATNHQRAAAVVALLRRLCIISGGPGTGKTTTVVKILALLQANARALGQEPLRILLLAPTGKAANRLVESIESQRAKWEHDPELMTMIPNQASTLHRALGYRPNHPTRFRHGRDNPLDADVVLVDEASMVDLALLTKLTEAVAPGARLILLGDKDQLASVEAGAVLGDLCGEASHWSRGLCARAAQIDGHPCHPEPGAPTQPGIWDSIVLLTHSYRFDAKSGIGSLAKAIHDGRGRTVVACFRERQSAQKALFDERDIRLVDPAAADLGLTLQSLIEDYYRAYLKSDDPAQQLAQFSRGRLLCAHRHGPLGVTELNQLAERHLAELRLIQPNTTWYPGRPVMITRNDYQLRLFNGDIGIVARDPRGGRTRVYFPTEDGQVRALVPAHLPPHETVYAMTVHKAQGSEFDRVTLFLPPEMSPILTRELVYTGVTRARHKVTVISTERVLQESVRKHVERYSGLRKQLWSGYQSETTEQPDPATVEATPPIEQEQDQLALF